MESPILSVIDYVTVDFSPCKVCKDGYTFHLQPEDEDAMAHEFDVCLECRIKGSNFVLETDHFIICANCLSHGFEYFDWEDEYYDGVYDEQGPCINCQGERNYDEEAAQTLRNYAYSLLKLWPSA